ncbi:MAG: TetR/AcrR family transcriptional regulator [Hyphomonadaceae bacterium]|nr:TetR/AcrR family transcriptional regulator [Hyphomonadaceae bacterium]
MPVISTERMRDRRDSILAAASRVFSQKGFQAASIAEIARAAGVSDGLVYKYFENKRELLISALTAFYERVIDDLEQQVELGETFADRLRLLVQTHLGVFVRDTGLCRLFISEVRVATDYPGSAIQVLNKRYTAVLLRIVHDGIRNGEVRPDTDPRVVRDLLFGAVEHVAWRHVTTRKAIDCDRLGRQIAGMIVGGIAPPRPAARRRAAS